MKIKTLKELCKDLIKSDRSFFSKPKLISQDLKNEIEEDIQREKDKEKSASEMLKKCHV